jgi:hypothetical protein
MLRSERAGGKRQNARVGKPGFRCQRRLGAAANAVAMLAGIAETGVDMHH